MMDRKKRRDCYFWCIIVLLCFCFNISTVRLFYTGNLVSQRNIPITELISAAVSISETVISPDQALVFLKYPPSTVLFTKEDINCIYLKPNSSQPHLELSPESIDRRYENQQIVRCPLPPRGTIVSVAVKDNGNLIPGPTYKWDSLAYDAVIDRDNSTVVFVKGLNLQPGKVADSSRFQCIYGWDLSDSSKYVLWGDVVSAAQEIVRCKTPLSILKKFNSSSSGSVSDPIKVSVRIVGAKTLDSVARVRHQLNVVKPVSDEKRHKMCVCTMVRNEARALREWVMYHGRIGVERWFIYDNNSNDDIECAVKSLVGANYNVSRHIWPWIKTQEAGLAHCALRARESCEWVGFIDVDEFLHFPSDLSLNDVVSDRSRPSEVGELRVPCHTFGPSGLRKAPKKGVMAGYTCRLAKPERHKSIVKPEALDSSLINVVHHFQLKPGYSHVDMKKSNVVINHYKYQVWKVFKQKFYRRAATYVADWQEERDIGSKDRAPGLGTKAVKPPNWRKRFCQVKDTGLRDWVVETLTDPKTGLLPWEDQLDQ